MFYATQIKSVGNGFAVDVQGKCLQFIGYLPVKSGDTVYTDGNVIFGNAPPKGAPVVFDEPSGIPVLADYDSQGDKLRGYFKLNGKYKNYRIAGDDWIINDKKIFSHDNGEHNIIDAEIASDGSLFTVEKKVSQINQDAQNDSKIFFFHYYNWHAFTFDAQDYFSMMNLKRDTRGYLTYQESSGAGYLDSDSDFVKNTVPFVKQAQSIIDGDNYIFIDSEFIDRADNPIDRDCELIIRKDDTELYTVNLSDLVAPAEKVATDYINITVPGQIYKDYIKSRANLCNFKIYPDGKWQLLLEIEIGAERDYPRPEADRYDQIDKSRDWLGYSTVAVHSLFLFKIDSDGNAEKIAERTKFMHLWLINNINWNSIHIDFHIEAGIKTPPDVDSTTFPYDDWVITLADMDGWTGEGYSEFTTFTVYNSHNLPFAKNVEKFADFNFPVQDNFHALLKNYAYEIGGWQLSGIFDAEGNQLFADILPDETDAHKWNMSLATLKGGGCLFGIRKDDDRDIDGALYKIDNDGKVEQVGNGLKNFRLRELKKISRAKK